MKKLFNRNYRVSKQTWQMHNKALLIGINYTHGSKTSRLSGCINDTKHVLDHLKTQFEHITLIKLGSEQALMKDENDDVNHLYVVYMTDAPEIPQSDPNYPSRANMLTAFRWLAKETEPGHRRFLHYSGHGSRVYDRNGDELDKYDETLVPADYCQAGMIVDDELRRVLVNPLPAGASLHAILDCCHSGTAMDLRYGLLDANDYTSFIGRMFTNATTEFENTRASVTGADVVLWSGCRDSQTSADAWNEARREFGGALTMAFLETLKESASDATYRQIWHGIRDKLANKYTQKSQLSSGRKLDLDARFEMM